MLTVPVYLAMNFFISSSFLCLNRCSWENIGYLLSINQSQCMAKQCFTFSVTPSMANLAVGSKQFSFPGRAKTPSPPSATRISSSARPPESISVWVFSFGRSSWALEILRRRGQSRSPELQQRLVTTDQSFECNTRHKKSCFNYFFVEKKSCQSLILPFPPCGFFCTVQLKSALNDTVV